MWDINRRIFRDFAHALDRLARKTSMRSMTTSQKKCRGQKLKDCNIDETIIDVTIDRYGDF